MAANDCSRNTAILKKYDEYQVDTAFLADDVTVTQDTADPCSVDVKWKTTTDNNLKKLQFSALALVANTKVTRRFRGASGPKNKFRMPCPSCHNGSPWDDLAVDRWKKGLPNSNYDNKCKKNAGQPNEYYDICCIQEEILIEGRGAKHSICDMDSRRYGVAKELYNKANPKNKIGNNPCPGGGELVFAAQVSVRMRLYVEYEASAYYGPDLEHVTVQGTGTHIEQFGKDILFPAGLQPIVEATPFVPTYPQLINSLTPGEKKTFGKIKTLPNGQQYWEFDNSPQGCRKLEEQGKKEGRPCVDGCKQCPWYNVSLSCGFRFYDCTATGRDLKDIRCRETGLSVADNSGTKINSLGEVIRLSISGCDSGACKDEQVQRKGKLPCAPPPAFAGLASEAYNIADIMKKYNWTQAFSSLVGAAKESAKAKLPPGPCSPIAYRFLQRGIQVL